MTTVYYFSGSGKTKEVATFVANELSFPLKEISENEHDCQDAAVVVFPVYCQNIPKPVYNFLKKLDAEKIALIATYGRISHGNVLKECELALKGKIIAAVYLPCNHSYLSDKCDFSKDDLKSIIAKIKQSNQSDCVKIPKRKNAISPIGILEYNGRKVMLTGDSNEINEPLVMARTGKIDCDILKVGHHGSATSTSTAFLDCYTFEYALISCNEAGNTFNHPRQDTLDRLAQHNINVYRTDNNGNIVVSVDKDGNIKITTEKEWNQSQNLIGLTGTAESD